MAIEVRKFRLHNPAKTAKKRSSSTRTRRARKKNPGTLLTLGFTNPHRTKSMKKRKKNSSGVARKRSVSRRRRHTNPTVTRQTKRHTRRRHRNPAVLSKSTEWGKAALAALIGLVAARQAPQFALGSKNTGIVGYLATIATAFATGLAVRKVAGPTAGHAAWIGGSMQIASRLLNEYVSPVGKVLSLSGVGDATACGLGEIRESYFPLPVPTERGTMTPIIPAALRPPQLPAPAGATPAVATMSGTGRRTRFQSRF